MTRKELSRNYWRYYRMLEDKFLATANFVEINPANFSSFSNEYALLLQSIGAELDNFFKVYCGFNLTDRKTITDYITPVLRDFPSITEEQIKVLGTDIIVSPSPDGMKQLQRRAFRGGQHLATSSIIGSITSRRQIRKMF